MVNPYNVGGAAAGAGAGGMLGRALSVLDYPRQALWNIPDKIAQGDYGAAVPGLLGLGAGIGTAALGGGLPLAFLAGSLAGGAGQAVGSAEDPERFKAPTAEDLTGSDSWLLNTLTSMAGDPLTYAGAGGGHAAADALRPKSVLEKFPTTGFYGELPDASKPLVTLAQEAPKPPPPDLSPLSMPREYTFTPPAGGMAPQSTESAMRQYLNMLHDLGIEQKAGMVSASDAMATQQELWQQLQRLSHDLPPEAGASFYGQFNRPIYSQESLLNDINAMAHNVGARPDMNRPMSGGWPEMAYRTKLDPAPPFVDPEIAREVVNHQMRLGDAINEARSAYGNLENDVYSRFMTEAEAGATEPRLVRGNLPAMDELLNRLRDLNVRSSRRRLRDRTVENIFERYPPPGGYGLDLGDLE